ncbi:MAG: hypothetical protein ACKO3N_20375 [Verrucomicrobiota bacterium]
MNGWRWMVRIGLSLLAAWPGRGAERLLDFQDGVEGRMPPGWESVLAGQGAAPEWKLVYDAVPSAFQALSEQAPQVNRRGVLAQVSMDPTDERFPVAWWSGERFGDFTARLRLKLVAGKHEQLAGLVFRATDARNFYVARASALGNNVRFYKFVNGERSAPIGPDLPVESGRWHELTVRCEGNRIDISWNGRPAIPTLTDNSFVVGRIGVLTKSDTVAYFSDLRLEYRPLKTLADRLVEKVNREQPRLLDFRVYGRTSARPELHVMAAKAGEVGRKAGGTEEKVWTENQAYFSKARDAAVVTAPLHDRNGEVLGVAQFVLKPYAGQMESVTIGKVLPWVRQLENLIGGSRDLTE